MELVQEIRAAWTRCGIQSEVIEEHINQWRGEIEQEDSCYYGEYFNNTIVREIISIYKDSVYFNPGTNCTTNEINEVNFVDFCYEMGITQEAATHWLSQYTEREMEITPPVYIFAALHKVASRCCCGIYSGNPPCNMSWNCPRPECFNFDSDIEDVPRLDPDDFITYGKRRILPCELLDHNTDYDGLIALLENNPEDLVTQVKRHCQIHPELYNIYKLLKGKRIGGLVGQRYSQFPGDQRTKALEMCRFLKRRERVIFGQGQPINLGDGATGTFYSISQISLAPH